MPYYEVEHIAELTGSQKEAIALGITEAHSTRFKTPRLFVNVSFTNVKNQDIYVAGKLHLHNRIRAQVRRGPSRTQADFDALAAEVQGVWARAVHPDRETPAEPELELRTVWIAGEILSAWEAGFFVPAAGKDVEWAKENMAAFERRAAEGDEDFADLVRDLKGREEFR